MTGNCRGPQRPRYSLRFLRGTQPGRFFNLPAVRCGSQGRQGAHIRSGAGCIGKWSRDPVTCPSCGAVNSDQALRCSKCGSPLKEPVQAKTTVSTPVTSKKVLAVGVVLGILAFCLLAAGLGAYFLFMRPSASQTATVESMSWKTRVAL